MFSKLWNVFGARKRMRCARSDAGEISDFVKPFLHFITRLASPGLEKSVPTWDLANPLLTRFLAYVGGVLDVADYLLKTKNGKSRGDTLGVYIAFYWYVELAFDGFPNIDLVLKGFSDYTCHALERNSEIAGMPWMIDDDYDVYQKLGTDDFLNFLRGEAGFFPIGLVEVGVLVESV